MEIRALAGAQIDADSHGEVDFGVRSVPWAAELYTDTIQLAYTPEFKKGKGWILLRAEGGAAGLMISPWTGGAPDPSRARLASYAGPEAGAMVYGPGGTAAGAQLRARAWFLGAIPGEPVPGPGFVGTADALAGWWHGPLAMSLVGGADFMAGFDGATDAVLGAPVSPHVAVETLWRPRSFVAPRVELRAGMAGGTGNVDRSRVGGEMPYGVPLAGAGWSEFWVDDYAALRVGLGVGHADAAPGSGAGSEGKPLADGKIHARASAILDVAELDFSLVAGAAARLELRRNRWWVQAELADGFGVPRAGAVPAVSGMVRLGVDWLPVGRGAAAR